MIAEDVFVAETAIVEEDVCLGAGTKVWHGALVRRGARIGAGCVIGRAAEIGPGVTIGDGTHVGAGAQVHAPARVGEHVHILPNAFVSNDRYPDLVSDFGAEAVVIEHDAVICAGVYVRAGVRIGQGAVCGMRAIVTKDVAPGEIVYGEGTAAVVRGRRAQHWPGTAVEHWGPLEAGKQCRRCEAVGMEQYEAYMERMRREDG